MKGRLEATLLSVIAFLLLMSFSLGFSIPRSCTLSAWTSFAKPNLPSSRLVRKCTFLKMSSSSPQHSVDQQKFGPFRIPSLHVFYSTSLSCAFVNLRPIVPGHVLVIPKRVVPLLSDMTTEEYSDFWQTVRMVQQILKRQNMSCEAFNIAIQDGKGAGQSVPHVHCHILPRQDGDFERNDDVYSHIDNWAPRDEMRMKQSKQLDVPNDDDRQDRTTEEMAEEAAIYRELAAKL